MASLSEQDKKRIEDAMWAGDRDTLEEIAYCECCCEEHTFFDCPARLWHGCRGQYAFNPAIWDAWADLYERVFRMTRSQFFGYERTRA